MDPNSPEYAAVAVFFWFLGAFTGFVFARALRLREKRRELLETLRDEFDELRLLDGPPNPDDVVID